MVSARRGPSSRERARSLSTARMDRHTDSTFERLEIVETGRRRRWSEVAKERIVLENRCIRALFLQANEAQPSAATLPGST